MSFAKLVGNQRNKEILQRLLKNGRVNSTLIFAGPDGVGKRQFALAFAKAANCQKAPASADASDGCDECSVCRRINAGGYGDVTVVRPEGQFIKIAQTREMAEEVYFRPREGRQRFFIIDEADRLREEAANSLLKTLEEPPSTSTIILLTARPDALLSTILARAAAQFRRALRRRNGKVSGRELPAPGARHRVVGPRHRRAHRPSHRLRPFGLPPGAADVDRTARTACGGRRSLSSAQSG